MPWTTWRPSGAETAVTVRADRGDVAYEVGTVRGLRQGAVARDAERLFSQHVPGRLVVLTCEDWDGEPYLSNVVVVAEPVAVARPLPGAGDNDPHGGWATSIAFQPLRKE